MNYSELSISLTKQLQKLEKKNGGIYFTPPNTIHTVFNLLKPYIKDINTVLEPSCGSCEFITALNQLRKGISITGIEYNKTIFNSIKFLENENIKLLNEDYLNFKSSIKYDLVIGNPPYFVMKKTDVNISYFNYFDGRPNIFILFIIKSLGLLNENGILSFVLPKSFLNCLYYNKTRHYITQNFKILHIQECVDNYIETKQETIILNLQKKKSKNTKYILNFGENIIFNTATGINMLKEYYKTATTLKKMNFEVKVGNVVWNQVKDKLTTDDTKTRLIYSSDIVENKLNIKKYKNVEKKNYVDKKGTTDLLLVVNRGYGKGKYKFSYCLIDTDKEYLVENHLICIKYLEKIERNALLEKYKLIINSLKSDKTKQFIELYCGNNALNTKELATVVPIYL